MSVLPIRLMNRRAQGSANTPSAQGLYLYSVPLLNPARSVAT